MRRIVSKQVFTAIITLAAVAALMPSVTAQQVLLDQGRQIVEAKNCRNCHSISGKGASGPGPDLDQVTNRRTPDWLHRWLRNPQAIEPGTLMPTFDFSDAEIDALIEFLESLATPGATPGISEERPADKSGSSLPLTKSRLAIILAALTIIAAWSMFERLGSPRRPWLSRETALLIHRINGYLFTTLALLISVLCAGGFLRGYGEWSPRVTLHIVAATVVPVVLGLKIVLARRYSTGLGNLLPPLGTTLVIATWVLVVGSAAFYMFSNTR